MIDRFRRARARVAADVAGPLCLSAPVLWTFFGVTFAFTLLTDIGLRQEEGEWWLPLGLASTLITIALLLLARMILVPASWERPRLLLVLTLYVVAALVRNGLIVLIIDALGGRLGTDAGLVDVSPTSRIFASVFLAVVAMALVSAATHSAHEHSRLRGRLEATERRLIVLASTMQERVAAARAALASEARAQIDPTMNRLRSRLDELPEDQTVDDIARMLSDAVTHVVRPMSHSLAEREVRALIEDETQEETRAERPTPTIDVVGAIRPLATMGISVLFFLLVAPFWGVLPRTFIGAITVNALAGFGLWLVREAWPQRWRVLTRDLAIPVLVVMYTIVMSASLVVAVPFAVSRDLSTFLLVVGVVVRIGIGLAVSTVVITNANRRAAEERLAAKNLELEQLVAALRRELWATKRELALLLHGPLQSTLVSSALLLSRPGISGDDLAAVRDRIEQALAQLDAGEQHAASITLALAETAALWSGSLEVAWSVSEPAVARLNGDPGLAAAAAEIVREAVSNAARHGGASHAVVSVDVDEGGDLVRVQVHDDGRVRAGSGEYGLGSRVLDEVAYRWNREVHHSGASLVADLR